MFNAKKAGRKPSNVNSVNQAHNDSDIDVTPMLDVVFIMLIFFIVTASFVNEAGFGINTPDTHQRHNTASISPIVIEVAENNEIRIQNMIVLEPAIRATLVRLRAELPDSPVVVRMHPKAKTMALVAAVDGARAADFLSPQVSLIGG